MPSFQPYKHGIRTFAPGVPQGDAAIPINQNFITLADLLDNAPAAGSIYFGAAAVAEPGADVNVDGSGNVQVTGEFSDAYDATEAGDVRLYVDENDDLHIEVNGALDFSDTAVRGVSDLQVETVFVSSGIQFGDGAQVTNLRVQAASTAPSNPSAGLLYLNLSDGRFYGYTGSVWKALSD